MLIEKKDSKTAYFITTRYHLILALSHSLAYGTKATFYLTFENQNQVEGMETLLNQIANQYDIEFITFTVGLRWKLKHLLRIDKVIKEHEFDNFSKIIVFPWYLDRFSKPIQRVLSFKKNRDKVEFWEDGALMYLLPQKKMSKIRLLKDFIIGELRPQQLLNADNTFVSYPDRFQLWKQNLKKIDWNFLVDAIKADQNLKFLNQLFDVESLFLQLKQYSRLNIIFTQPFYLHGLVSSEERQRQIFQKLIERYASKNELTILKLHPADPVDYNWNSSLNVMMIKQTFPSEMFLFNGISFYKSIGVFSSAVESVSADEYIYDTKEYDTYKL